MLTQSERTSNIPEEEAARKDKSSHALGSSLNKEGKKEGKVA